MRISLKIILIAVLCISVNRVFAFEVEDKNEYLVDVRGDDGDLYLNRLSVNKRLETVDLEMFLFGEAQWNFDTNEWEKTMLGLGGGKYFWKYLYIGQTIQLTSGEILDHMVFKTDSKSFDTTTKIGVRVPFLKNFSFNVFEEYSVNLEETRDEYCESLAEIVFRPSEAPFAVGIGWRHTDRIHNFDSDYATSFFKLLF